MLRWALSRSELQAARLLMQSRKLRAWSAVSARPLTFLGSIIGASPVRQPRSSVALGGIAARELVGRDVLRHHFPAVAPEIESALGAAEFDLAGFGRGAGAVGVELGVGDQGVAGIMPERLHRVRDLAVVLDGEPAAHGRDGQRGVLPEGPVNHVEVMNAHVGDLAAAVVEEPAELVEAAVAVVGHLAGRPQPGFPVQVRTAAGCPAGCRCPWATRSGCGNSARP